MALVPWQLLSGPWRDRRSVHGAFVASAVGVAILVTTEALHGPSAPRIVATWLIAVSATVALALHVHHWWNDRRSGDPLAGWLLAGVLAAWLSIVPHLLDVVVWRLPGRHVVRAAPAPRDRAAGGRWGGRRRHPRHPVARPRRLPPRRRVDDPRRGHRRPLHRHRRRARPARRRQCADLVPRRRRPALIAVGLEPARHSRAPSRRPAGLRHARRSTRRRPRVVDHLGADAGDELLPALGRQPEGRAAPRRRRHRLAWPTAGSGRRRPGHRPRTTGWSGWSHGAQAVGRLVVGWEHAPSLRPRDEEVLTQLVGPLSLAVGWVSLAAELRRSSLAIVSAREEERRRLRRDLHDGLGPALTGVSLGLRTAVRQLDRSVEGAGPVIPPTAARPGRRRGRLARRRAQAHRARPAADGPRPARPRRRGRRVRALRSPTIWRSTWSCLRRRSSCRPRSRWPRTASSPRP